MILHGLRCPSSYQGSILRMIMRDGGKGDAPRPIGNMEQFLRNWDEIFKKNQDQNANQSDNSKNTNEEKAE